MNFGVFYLYFWFYTNHHFIFSFLRRYQQRRCCVLGGPSTRIWHLHKEGINRNWPLSTIRIQLWEKYVCTQILKQDGKKSEKPSNNIMIRRPEIKYRFNSWRCCFFTTEQYSSIVTRMCSYVYVRNMPQDTITHTHTETHTHTHTQTHSYASTHRERQREMIPHYLASYYYAWTSFILPSYDPYPPSTQVILSTHLPPFPPLTFLSSFSSSLYLPFYLPSSYLALYHRLLSLNVTCS